MTDLMEKWLKKSGASGLDDLELVDFPDTGRGIRTLQQFEEGEKLLVIPHGVLWTGCVMDALWSKSRYKVAEVTELFPRDGHHSRSQTLLCIHLTFC